MTNTPPPPPPPDQNNPQDQGSVPPPPPPDPDQPPAYQQPQQYQQQPQYAQAGGGAPQPHPRGNTILILGILSIFCLGIVLGTIAFIMGNNALKEIDANPAAYTNRSTVNAGRIIGLIGAILNVIGFIVLFASG